MGISGIPLPLLFIFCHQIFLCLSSNFPSELSVHCLFHSYTWKKERKRNNSETVRLFLIEEILPLSRLSSWHYFLSACRHHHHFRNVNAAEIVQFESLYSSYDGELRKYNFPA